MKYKDVGNKNEQGLQSVDSCFWQLYKPISQTYKNAWKLWEGIIFGPDLAMKYKSCRISKNTQGSCCLLWWQLIFSKFLLTHSHVAGHRTYSVLVFLADKRKRKKAKKRAF